MGVATDVHAPHVGLHRRRRPGWAGDGPVARSLRDRCGDRREEPDHDRPSQVARLLGPHHGDLPPVGDRAGASATAACRTIPTCSSRSRASPAARSAARGPSPISARRRPGSRLVAQDAVEEEIYKRHRALEPGAGAFLDRVHRLRGDRRRRRSARSAPSRPAAPNIGTPNICSPATAPAARTRRQGRHRHGRAGVRWRCCSTNTGAPTSRTSRWHAKPPATMVYSKTPPACRRAPASSTPTARDRWLSASSRSATRRTSGRGRGPKPRRSRSSAPMSACPISR